MIFAGRENFTWLRVLDVRRIMVIKFLSEGYSTTMTGSASINLFYRTARGGGEGLALSRCAC